ncbi:MAG TPA: SAM-dependent DNA methyltransferase, partial [Candidatus Atribacteria bacterium]|nr:SAM-dependent DNA methyltransferase [Candidatus Atribacteria bacterium]
PEKSRSVPPLEEELFKAIRNNSCTCLIDTPDVKDEFRGITFPQVLLRIKNEIIPRLQRKEQKSFPLDTVIALLQQHVSELMQKIRLSDEEIFGIITDKELLLDIGKIPKMKTDDTAKFLAAYIILSQILFLRLFSRTRRDILPRLDGRVTRHWLRSAFKRIWDINYRPIFSVDVLDTIPEDYVRDTFDLIWGLEVERVRYELPGRIFHELMPKDIRKLLAAFYTRPQAADLLARLTIKNSGDTVFDPACGSGTILVSAYRRKLELFKEEQLPGNPHKRFSEEELFGSDIMPFAVHLTCANLASMDTSTTIERTQIIQGDSLKLSSDETYRGGIQTTLFPTKKEGYTSEGKRYDVKLGKVDVVLMNPPFTKVERGIRRYIEMEQYGKICGNEVGLWGHFIALADVFLKDNGVFGGVIPISILRGRESKKIREFVFTNWTPLYIIKSTFNYGFSEWSEYRDILLIAQKRKPSKGHKVKFVLIKKNLKRLSREDISHIADQIEIKDSLRSEELDIESFPIEELKEKFINLMWFCGVSDFKHRDMLVQFINKFSDRLTKPPRYFREGYRPVPKGVSSFMFFTRNINPSRTKQAFLFFDNENKDYIKAKSILDVEYKIEKTALTPTLRTGVGIKTMDLKNKLDYIAVTPFKDFRRILRASGFKKPKNFLWAKFWKNVAKELEEVKTKIVTLHRINPYSPNTNLISFFSEIPFSPSNVLNVVKEDDKQTAKAFCVLLNSALFLSQFFLLKE